GDARAVDDCEIGGERRIEREEPLVEHGDRRLRQLRVLYYWGHGHQCRASVGRNFGLVVPVLAARLLPGGNRERGLPGPLLGESALSRAQLHRLPAAGGVGGAAV